jgi:hypothetical protein
MSPGIAFPRLIPRRDHSNLFLLPDSEREGIRLHSMFEVRSSKLDVRSSTCFPSLKAWRGNRVKEPGARTPPFPSPGQRRGFIPAWENALSVAPGIESKEKVRAESRCHITDRPNNPFIHLSETQDQLRSSNFEKEGRADEDTSSILCSKF